MARKPKQVNAEICKNDIKHRPIRNKKTYENDFITRYEDVEKEVRNYEKQFDGMKVLCPCNDLESGIGDFFVDNFKKLKLKELCLVEYKEDNSDAQVVTFTKNDNVEYGWEHKEETIKGWNGDVFSDHSYNKELWSESENGYNIIVTNIGGVYKTRNDKNDNRFTKLVSKCVNCMKKFLIVGNGNAVAYKEIFPLIKENKIWLGHKSFSGGMNFIPGDTYDATKCLHPKTNDKGDTIINVMMCLWFTNLEHNKRNEVLELTKTYSNKYYPKYDNYDAIDVSHTRKIPMDYDGVMGVPITFLDKYNPNQFEIIGLGIANLGLSIGIRGYLPEHREYRKNIEHKGVVDGDLYYLDNNGHPKVPYARILIRHKK